MLFRSDVFTEGDGGSWWTPRKMFALNVTSSRVFQLGLSKHAVTPNITGIKDGFFLSMQTFVAREVACSVCKSSIVSHVTSLAAARLSRCECLYTVVRYSTQLVQSLITLKGRYPNLHFFFQFFSTEAQL